MIMKPDTVLRYLPSLIKNKETGGQKISWICLDLSISAMNQEINSSYCSLQCTYRDSFSVY